MTCVIKFKTYDEAIESANDSGYGLAADYLDTRLKRLLMEHNGSKPASSKSIKTLS